MVSDARRLARARRVAGAARPGQFWDVKWAVPHVVWAWGAGGAGYPGCLAVAASLLLDGMPARPTELPR